MGFGILCNTTLGSVSVIFFTNFSWSLRLLWKHIRVSLYKILMSRFKFGGCVILNSGFCLQSWSFILVHKSAFLLLFWFFFFGTLDLLGPGFTVVYDLLWTFGIWRTHTGVCVQNFVRSWKYNLELVVWVQFCKVFCQILEFVLRGKNLMFLWFWTGADGSLFCN